MLTSHTHLLPHLRVSAESGVCVSQYHLSQMKVSCHVFVVIRNCRTGFVGSLLGSCWLSSFVFPVCVHALHSLMVCTRNSSAQFLHD